MWPLKGQQFLQERTSWSSSSQHLGQAKTIINQLGQCMEKTDLGDFFDGEKNKGHCFQVINEFVPFFLVNMAFNSSVVCGNRGVLLTFHSAHISSSSLWSSIITL